MPQNDRDEPVFTININLGKINALLAITCVLLSLFKEQYDYINGVYNCLFTILIYNNIVFIYILYLNRKSL